MIAKMYVLVLFFALMVSSCEWLTGDESNKKETVEEPSKHIPNADSLARVELKSETDEYLKSFGMVDILSIDSSIQIDLRYATSNNFMGIVLYDTLQSVYLQADVAERIALCQQYLKTKHPTYSLLIYDGVRPLEVQREMWNALDTLSIWERGKYVSNPTYGSVHNYGAAVDITICKADGTPLDMGAGFDDFREIAHPALEWKFIQSGELTEKHIKNRELLREVMVYQAFRNLPTEWWHFNAYSRNVTRTKYRKLYHESSRGLQSAISSSL
jgi:zinc D-Ala-D-Ala dipeptidase